MRDFWRGEAGRPTSPARFTGSATSTSRRPRPVRVDQLHHRPRRLHAARPRLLQRQAQRGQPWRTTATGPTTTAPGTAASRGRRTTRRSSRCATRQIRNFLTTLMLSQRHADAARRRRVRPHPGRQQQRLVPGLRDLLVRLGPRAASSRSCSPSPRRLIALRQEHPVFHRSAFLAGEEVEGSGLPDAWWFRADGHRMTSERLDAGGPRARAVPQRRGDPVPPPRRRADRRRLLPAARQRPPRGRRRSRCPSAASATRWACELVHRRPRRCAGATVRRASREAIEVIVAVADRLLRRTSS